MAEMSKEELREFREHMSAAFQAWREGWKTLVPEGFWEKSKEGQKEALLALRSLLDLALEHVEGQGEKEAKTPKQKIEVEDES
jgi:hypothetical protein